MSLTSEAVTAANPCSGPLVGGGVTPRTLDRHGHVPGLAIFVDQRRAGRKSGSDRVGDRQPAIAHAEAKQRLPGCGRGLGRHGRDLLAGEAHDLAGQDPPVGEGPAVMHVVDLRQVSRGEDGDDAIHPFHRGGVDRLDAGVGVGATQDSCRQRPGKLDVSGVARRPRGLGFPVDVSDSGTDGLTDSLSYGSCDLRHASCASASRSAWMMPVYPVQRQMLPDSAWRSPMSPAGRLSRSIATPRTICPGVQKPH